MKLIIRLGLATVCMVPIFSHAVIYVSGSTSRANSGVCSATIKSIGTCYSPNDIFIFKVVTPNGLVEIDSKSTPPKGFELRYSINAAGTVDGYLLSYEYTGKTSATVTKFASDGTKSDVGKKSLNCIP